MYEIQVQVTDDGVLIPREYLPGDKFEYALSEDHILLRPKSNGRKDLRPSESSRFSFVGIAISSNPNASVEVEEILEKEMGFSSHQGS